MKCEPDCTCRRHADYRDEEVELARRLKISAFQLGRPKSEIQRFRTSLSQRRPEVLAKTQIHRGRKRSKSTSIKMSEGQRRRYLEVPEYRQRKSEAAKRIHANPSAAVLEGYRKSTEHLLRLGPSGLYAGTVPELQMAGIFEATGIEYDWQVRFGRYVVDFYLPRTNEVVEVDGVYFHPNGPDRARDQYLLDRGVAAVHHITDVELKEFCS